MDYQDKISTIVEEALTEKTFNLEIITKIKTLKDDFEQLTVKNEGQSRRINDLETENKSIRTINEKLLADNNAYKVRENEIAKSEKEADKSKYELEFQKKRGDEIKELFGIVFKNPVVQQQVYRNTSIPTPNGSYMSNVSENETVTHTTNT